MILLYKVRQSATGGETLQGGVNFTGLNLFTLSLERSSGETEEATRGREGAADGKVLELIWGPMLAPSR